MLTMNNKEYNGWYNYETWMVNLWMDNDQGSHEMWREHARDSIDADEGCNWFLFEDRLKDYLDMIQEDVDNGVACGLVHDLVRCCDLRSKHARDSMHWIADELENIEVTG